MGARGEEKLEGESLLAARRWQFGAAVLDERSLTLTVNDEVVELERKPLEVLLHLLHHAGEVVTKDELLAAVWPGRVLSDSALTSCMHKLRESLRDEQQELIRTQHGYGYRLVATVKVEASTAPAPPRFDLKAGDRPPGRPQWSLVERLGSGGHGEAWLARHDKTREARVFKFAADGAGLASLKREITLSRLLHDALGGRRDIVRIIDWNLEDAPYFIEAGWSQSGSLVGWAREQGGADKIPLATRLELAAQVAEALAAAHSVGVLHKDLKPSNVLVELDDDAKPRIKLSDFGSGGVLDIQRLEQMGITRMGFTQTVSASSGTPMYLAPEVISGQPFTIQSDVYALGVVLYQMVVGDLARPLAPGWERDVADELLREDIASAAEGTPERRMADAARLAQRLRALAERRALREAEHRARAEAEQARLEVERAKARRMWVRLVVAASLAGVAVSSWLYFRARQAAATTEAVSDFLNNDVLSSADPWSNPTRSMTIKQALDRAAAEVPKRFADQPEVVARLSATIGTIYLRMQEWPIAREHLQRAVALYTDLEGMGSERRLSALKALSDALNELSQGEQACAGYQDILRQRRDRLGEEDVRVLRARYDAALCTAGTDLALTRDELKAILERAQAAGVSEPDFLDTLKSALASTYGQTGQLAEAERLHREVLASLSERLGEHHLRTALQRKELALLLDKTGGDEEAGRQLEQGLADLNLWAGDTNNQSIEFLALLGNIRIHQERFEQATGLLETAIARTRAAYGDEHFYLTQLPVILANAYRRQGRVDDAIRALKPALALSGKLNGSEHRFTLDIGINLVGCLREKGEPAQAWAALNAISMKGLQSLPPQHYLFAGYLRQKGLLLQADGNAVAARDALAGSLAAYEHAIGPDHPVTVQVRAELAHLTNSGG